jgi:hypothetical protein
VTVAPGVYLLATLHLEGLGYIDEWYGGAPKIGNGPEAAVPVDVTESDAVDIDFDLDPSLTISGRVMDDRGDPAGAIVYAYDQEGTAVEWRSTDASGDYVLGRLPPGIYEVRTESGMPWDQWYDGISVQGHTQADATPVTVGPGSVTGIDFTLDTGLPLTVSLTPGWNLVAAGPTAQFPGTLFGWNGASYVSTTLSEGWRGYWCKVGDSVSVEAEDLHGPHTTILAAGWNLIGNPMGAPATLTLPAGRTAFVYNAVSRTYESTNALAPGQGAWVKAEAGQTVVFTASSP